MIKIISPNNNIPERTYSIKVLFSDLLGCKQNDYEIQFDNSVKNYEINFDGYNIIIEDHFFIHYKEPLSYLKVENIPTSLHFFHGLGLEIPMIYGEDKFIKDEHTIIVGLDIFASTFFMLTRWEESLLGREEKGDCDETLLFAVKNGIFNRPIVNEYASFLRTLLPENVQSSTRKYNVVLSHDVDGFVSPSWKKIAKDIVRQTLYGAPKNKVLNLTWKEEIKYKRAFPSAYSQFELYTAIAEKYNIQEWFYFKVCDKGEKEATYLYNDKRAKEVVCKLKEKNNPNIVLGFHPSQNVFGNEQQWEKEVSRITDLLQEKYDIGRNHHLLFNHETLRLWESMTTPLNISNCVFHRRHGFRSGVCIPYHLFDLYKRRAMNLIEHPCQIMDTVIRYDEKNKSEEERWDDIQTIIDEVRKHQGEMVLTWHIYIRNKKIIQDYFHWCEKVMRYAVIKK